MFSMKMYPIDTLNCFLVLPEETLVVRYMRQDVSNLAEETDQTVRTTIFMVSARRVNLLNWHYHCSILEDFHSIVHYFDKF